MLADHEKLHVALPVALHAQVALEDDEDQGDHLGPYLLDLERERVAPAQRAGIDDRLEDPEDDGQPDDQDEIHDGQRDRLDGVEADLPVLVGHEHDDATDPEGQVAQQVGRGRLNAVLRRRLLCGGRRVRDGSLGRRRGRRMRDGPGLRFL